MDVKNSNEAAIKKNARDRAKLQYDCLLKKWDIVCQKRGCSILVLHPL
jgi:hypothetical protein